MMNRREFLRSGTVVAAGASALGTLSATTGSIRITPDHPAADHIEAIRDGQRVLQVEWYECPSGRYGTVHWKEEEIRGLRAGVGGVEEIRCTDGIAHITWAADGTWLRDRRTGLRFEA